MMMMKKFEKNLPNSAEAPLTNTATLHQQDDDDASSDEPSFIIQKSIIL